MTRGSLTKRTCLLVSKQLLVRPTTVQPQIFRMWQRSCFLFLHSLSLYLSLSLVCLSDVFSWKFWLTFYFICTVYVRILFGEAAYNWLRSFPKRANNHIRDKITKKNNASNTTKKGIHCIAQKPHREPEIISDSEKKNVNFMKIRCAASLVSSRREWFLMIFPSCVESNCTISLRYQLNVDVIVGNFLKLTQLQFVHRIFASQVFSPDGFSTEELHSNDENQSHFELRNWFSTCLPHFRPIVFFSQFTEIFAIFAYCFKLLDAFFFDSMVAFCESNSLIYFSQFSIMEIPSVFCLFSLQQFPSFAKVYSFIDRTIMIWTHFAFGLMHSKMLPWKTIENEWEKHLEFLGVSFLFAHVRIWIVWKSNIKIDVVFNLMYFYHSFCIIHSIEIGSKTHSFWLSN